MKENGHTAILSLQDVGLSYSARVRLFQRQRKWALRRVTFDVRKGETLGVIGRNGSGKSTLLQLLAGITEPDEGRIHRETGARAALLALKVGFLGHLTGRENAYLNGMLLGARKREIDGWMGAIQEFSELGHAFDEPFYTYSNGMRARLGFAAAIQVNPEILLLDEVLGVGDRGFKEKSTEYMKDRITSQRTVILVTHNMNQIRLLCDRAVWLENGKIRASGDPDAVVKQYEAFVDDRKLRKNEDGEVL